MIRNFISTICFAFMAMGAQSQTIDSLFTTIPDAVLPLLDHNSRLDMIDLYNCKMDAGVGNDLSGHSVLLEKDSTHVLVKTSDISRFEMRLLRHGNDTIYACVRTVEMPKEYSQLQFLRTDWYKAGVAHPADMTFERCWHPSDTLSEDRIESLRLALLPATFKMHWESLSDGTPRLICEVSVISLMKEDQKDALRCLRPLTYLWREGKLIPENN